MSLKIQDIEAFIAVTESGSISRAADNMHLPKSNISRHLKMLEEELGVRLLDRTTRSVTITEAGEIFLSGARRILLELEQLRSELSPDDQHLRGKLSVFAPTEFMSEILSPQLGLFTTEFPGLELEFLSGAAHPDLLHDRLDLIIHPDAPEDSSYVAVRLCSGRTDFYASPAYLAEHGQPQHPSELYHHSCIAELDQNRHQRPWQYRDGKNIREVRISPKYRSDSLATARNMMEQDLGIAMLPVFYCQAAVDKGRLTQLFDGRFQVDRDIFGVYSSRRLKPRKLEVFPEFLRRVLPDKI
jgi:DNA-binding transcriptional LysR family regulator